MQSPGPTSEADRTMVWGTTVNVGDVMNKFRAFFNQFTRQGEMEPLYPRLLAEVPALRAWA